MLVFQMGQPRIWMSISRDGLLPASFQKIHPKFKTPSFATILTGFVVGIPILFTDKTFVLDFTSIATLFAFVLVCGGVLLIPRIERSRSEGFSMPYINGKYYFGAIILAAIAILTYFNAEYWGQLFSFGDEANETTFKVSTIIFWSVCIVLAIMAYTINGTHDMFVLAHRYDIVKLVMVWGLACIGFGNLLQLQLQK
jgi:basic amino acid/polyamine antiporter, APA family